MKSKDVAVARSRLNARLHHEKHHKPWSELRDKLVEAGVDAIVAMAVAAQYFPPYDGSPVEFIDPRLDDEKLAAVCAPVIGDQQPTKTLESRMAEQNAKTKGEGPFSQNDAWAKLVSQVEPGRRAPAAVVLDWCFNNVENRPDEIDPVTVPSRGAITMLRASKTAGGYSQLLTMWAKTLPTGQQVKANSNFGDDGRQQLDMLDEFMESFDNESGPTEQ